MKLAKTFLRRHFSIFVFVSMHFFLLEKCFYSNHHLGQAFQSTDQSPSLHTVSAFAPVKESQCLRSGLPFLYSYRCWSTQEQVLRSQHIYQKRGGQCWGTTTIIHFINSSFLCKFKINKPNLGEVQIMLLISFKSTIFVDVLTLKVYFLILILK